MENNDMSGNAIYGIIWGLISKRALSWKESWGWCHRKDSSSQTNPVEVGTSKLSSWIQGWISGFDGYTKQAQDSTMLSGINRPLVIMMTTNLQDLFHRIKVLHQTNQNGSKGCGLHLKKLYILNSEGRYCAKAAELWCLKVIPVAFAIRFCQT